MVVNDELGIRYECLIVQGYYFPFDVNHIC